MKKKIIALMFVTCLLCGCSKTVSKLDDGKEAIASFDKKKLSISVDDLYKSLKDKYGTAELIDLIDSAILNDKYKDKLDDAEKDAEANLKSVKENFKDEDGNYSEKQLLAALKQYYGYNSIDQFKEMLKMSYLKTEATKEYAKGKITDSEIKKYYKDQIVGDREVSHIEIIPDVKDSMSDDEKKAAEEKALKEAKEVIAKLKKGEKFSDLAKKYSDDDDTKNKGGSLGYINKGDYGEDAFDTEVWSLEIGNYSNTPVKTSSGYEIVYVTKEKDKKELDDVKDEIIDALVDEKIASSSTLQLDALKQLRKDYGLNIEDEELKSSYNKYLDEQYTSATQAANQN